MPSTPDDPEDPRDAAEGPQPPAPDAGPPQSPSPDVEPPAADAEQAEPADARPAAPVPPPYIPPAPQSAPPVPPPPAGPPPRYAQQPAPRLTGAGIGAGVGIGCGAHVVGGVLVFATIGAVGNVFGFLWPFIVIAVVAVGLMFSPRTRSYGTGVLIIVAAAWIIVLGPCIALIGGFG